MDILCFCPDTIVAKLELVSQLTQQFGGLRKLRERYYLIKTIIEIKQLLHFLYVRRQCTQRHYHRCKFREKNEMSICDDARKTGTDKINAAYTPLIDEIARIIKNMQNRGLDPHKYYDPVKDQVVDLVALLADLGATRDQQLKATLKK